jgi:hypothetical protein
LFEDATIDHFHKAVAAHKNSDGGYGHAFEPDMRSPKSHPLALEFLLTVLHFHELPVGSVLVGTPEWVLANQQPDGALMNPSDLLNYPHAP